MALGETPLLRCVIRVLADTTDNLWYKGSNQSLLRYQDLFQTRVCFYAVHPSLIHGTHKGLALSHFQVREGAPVPEKSASSTFQPLSERMLRDLGSASPYGLGKPVGRFCCGSQAEAA